ncbi:hypothetical protein [Pseudobacteriovorax antillogorgiicola]|uniref:Uncharacterized protein n=1 Tax=Pseudobacteriovorax antillogorgiicola TaxID=1513793 RepID=A0A1Y6CAQ7_9BACT|nr:hypothetical protein [Pseudobacteriovorax antillogorgiicola]TCS48728.1 hypothetical protein EDD56_117150 [Pseudobacteriovorax antillogorgiicola]SMF54464.1 hypothetical protein SAMN06296036_1179 [Pseudobacteriovorax antillogorgiicola]
MKVTVIMSMLALLSTPSFANKGEQTPPVDQGQQQQDPVDQGQQQQDPVDQGQQQQDPVDQGQQPPQPPIVDNGQSPIQQKPGVYKYLEPKHPAGDRLDWCLTWANHCGQEAANAYCEEMGHRMAVDLERAADVGYTRLLQDDRMVCNGYPCDSFTYITCSN